MSIRVNLSLGLMTVLCGAGCHGTARFGSIHLEKPGTHVIASPGALSVARVTDGGARVCTRLTPAGHGGKKGKRPGANAGPAAALDTLLFRLCEARSNNDISAEQYATSVQSIVKMMSEARAGGPQNRAMRDGARMPMQRPGRPQGRRGPRWNRPADDDKASPAAPAAPDAKP